MPPPIKHGFGFKHANNIKEEANHRVFSARDRVRHHLYQTGELEEAFQQWQCHSLIELDSIQVLYPLLSWINLSRFEFHTSAVRALQVRLMQQINDLAAIKEPASYEKLLGLLDACYPGALNVDNYRPMVMKLLSLVPQMEELIGGNKLHNRFIRPLLEKRDLYPHMPLEVRRQMWEDDSELFFTEAEPLMESYASHQAAGLLRLDVAILDEVPKTRRKHDSVQKLAQMVGSSWNLYQRLTQHLCSRFLEKGCLHMATLRGDLLLVLNEEGVRHEEDRAAAFVLVLAACVRDNKLEQHQADKLHAEYQALRDFAKQQKSVSTLRDLASLCAEPHVLRILGLSLLRQLENVVVAQELPRSAPQLEFLLRALSLGLNAVEASRTGKEPRLSSDLLLTLMPAVAGLRVDLQMADLPGEKVAKIKLPKIYLASVLGRRLARDHCLHAVDTRDWVLLHLLLDGLRGTEAQWEPQLLQRLVLHLTSMTESNANVPQIVDCLHTVAHHILQPRFREDVQSALLLAHCAHLLPEREQLVSQLHSATITHGDALRTLVDRIEARLRQEDVQAVPTNSEIIMLETSLEPLSDEENLHRAQFNRKLDSAILNETSSTALTKS